MRFAVSLVRLLCGVMAGILLVAYLYFSINFEQTDLAISHTMAIACLWLFAVALLIWGGLAVMSDVWLKHIDNKEFYQKLMPTNEFSNSGSNTVADNSQQFSDLLSQINEANADSQKTLLSGIDNLNDKISALGDGALQGNAVTDDLREDVRLISQNMQEIQSQIETLLSQLQNQKKILSQLSDYPARLENGKTDYYPILQEEAQYPESVVNYQATAPEVDKAMAPTEDMAQTNDVLPETLTPDEPEFSASDNYENDVDFTQNQDIPLEDFIDEPLDTLPTAADADDILTADTDDITLEPGDFDTKADEVIDNLAPFAVDTDKSFASADAPIDIEVIEPAVNTRKDEPNLEHIFNDELASELADLEILNGKPTAKTQDDIDLEQFFAGYKKTLDK